MVLNTSVNCEDEFYKLQIFPNDDGHILHHIKINFSSKHRYYPLMCTLIKSHSVYQPLYKYLIYELNNELPKYRTENFTTYLSGRSCFYEMLNRSLYWTEKCNA